MEIKREGQERENEGIIALPTNTSHALDGERRRLMAVKLNGSTSAKERGREEERRRAGEGRKCAHNRLNLPGPSPDTRWPTSSQPNCKATNELARVQCAAFLLSDAAIL